MFVLHWAWAQAGQGSTLCHVLYPKGRLITTCLLFSSGQVGSPRYLSRLHDKEFPGRLLSFVLIPAARVSAQGGQS